MRSAAAAVVSASAPVLGAALVPAQVAAVAAVEGVAPPAD
jgi:hypothetical protein